MTDAVKRVPAETSTKYVDGQYRRSRLSDLRAQLLRTNKNEQSVFEEEKKKEYKQDIPELTNKQARKFAKDTRKNEVAAATVDNRMVYVDARKMEAYKKAFPNKEHVLLDPNKRFDAKILKIIAEHPEDFYVDGEFSSDQFKRRIGKYTGFDNKGNLDEQKAFADDYGVGKRTARRAMKRAGYEREKDLTILYKTLAAMGALGASAGTGALVGSRFTSNVIGIHNNGSQELLDTITTTNAYKVGALRGLLAGVIPAVALALTVKDNGGKDIFNGISADEIVAKGEKGIETRIRGDKNQKIMKAILKMPNISNEDKAIILKLAYGELTGKKVNDRELAAAYEIAKYCNKHPEVDPKHYDDLPGKKPAKPEQGVVPAAQQIQPLKIDTPQPELCELSVKGQDGEKTHEYKVRYKDNPYNLVQGKYKRADGKPMTHKDIMALRNEIFGKNKGLRVGTIQIPDTQTVNGVKYVYTDGEVKTGKVDKVDLKYYTQKQYRKANYGVYDCNNKQLATNLTSKEDANKEAEALAKANPNKYVFGTVTK